MARQGRDKDLDILVDDIVPYVRIAVAHNLRECDLKKLSFDSDPMVKSEVDAILKSQDSQMPWDEDFF